MAGQLCVSRSDQTVSIINQFRNFQNLKLRILDIIFSIILKRTEILLNSKRQACLEWHCIYELYIILIMNCIFSRSECLKFCGMISDWKMLWCRKLKQNKELKLGSFVQGTQVYYLLHNSYTVLHVLIGHLEVVYTHCQRPTRSGMFGPKNKILTN